MSFDGLLSRFKRLYSRGLFVVSAKHKAASITTEFFRDIQIVMSICNSSNELKLPLSRRISQKKA